MPMENQGFHVVVCFMVRFVLYFNMFVKVCMGFPGNSPNKNFELLRNTYKKTDNKQKTVKQTKQTDKNTKIYKNKTQRMNKT